MVRAIPLIFLILGLATANSFLLPSISAAAYMPGVSVGNFIKFADSESYTSNDPTMQAEPQFLKNIDNTPFLRADVKNVFENNVTYTMTYSFNNGTADKVMTLVEDVNTGAGNATIGGIHYVFIASNLNPGDKVANNADALPIDQTVTGTYAGAARDIDLLSGRDPNATSSLTASQSWDRVSGALTEITFDSSQKSGSSGQYTTTWSDILIAKATNIWPASGITISQILFYAILGTVGAAAGITGVIIFTRTRRSNHRTNTPYSPQVIRSPDLSNLVQCNSCHGYNIPGASTCRHCGAQTQA